MTKNDHGNLARSAGSVSLAVFLSRILGLVREQVLAGLFGAGTAMDAFVVAFRIPNLARDLFAEGALSSAFVTVFSEYDATRSKEETLYLVNNVLVVITILISLLTIAGMLFSEDLVLLMAPDFAQVPGKVELTTQLTRVMFPFLLAVSMAALFMGMLNSRGHFFIPSMASSFFNLSSIVIGGGLAILMPRYGKEAVLGMAIGTLAGGLSQMAIQIPLLRREGLRFRPRLNLRHTGLRKIGVLVIPAIIGLSATQINIFINTNFASRCPEGSVAWLNYAFRLMQFPIGLFGVALSLVTLPVVARQAAKADLEAIKSTLVSSLSLAFALTIPAAAGLWILAEPIVALIFEHGRFSHMDTVMTAQAVRFYAIGLFAYASVKIIVPVFYALNDTRWPVIASFIAVICNVIIIIATLNALLHRAIALSTSITMIINFVFLAAVLYRKTGGYPVLKLAGQTIRIIAASVVMGLIVVWADSALPENPSLSGQLMRVSALITAGTITYVFSALVLNVVSLRDNVIRRFHPPPGQ